eukprot:CAMPEP_0171488552 /NCGR_PEP_ID=MMETSP0958-20121227/2264_1 /TAXON_ID=87120 /ORGANISM="Aurantiochytrium limacinum, Strain ATCCMYA-1381" /LENGTH=119 /DNA_ID=CAMNT_0012021665 /DNA_START=522 /DNA_END=882 /DNA_ORIENTATION=-
MLVLVLACSGANGESATLGEGGSVLRRTCESNRKRGLRLRRETSTGGGGAYAAADLKETCQTRGGSIHDQELLVVVVVVVMGCSGQSVGVHWVRTQEGSGHGKNAGGAEDLILRGITLV